MLRFCPQCVWLMILGLIHFNASYLAANDNTGIPYPVTKYRSFVVVILSYNNELYCKKNLKSVLEQDYPQFRVIYINDASEDRTLEMVTKISQSQKRKLEVIANEKRLGALANTQKAVNKCKDDEIVVVVDGDDWLPHNKVLSRLNAYYQSDDVWMSCGHYKTSSDSLRAEYSYPIPLRDLKKRKMRKKEWRAVPIRTFYAKLFKRIAISDLKRKGEFFRTAGDAAYMFPMFEMAETHAIYIPDILYVYNTDNPISDFRAKLKEQHKVTRYIRSLRKYDKLGVLFD